MRRHFFPLVACLCCFALAGRSADSNGPAVGSMAPDFTAHDAVTGEIIPLSSQRGKIVILTSWASWCGPCRRELPFLANVQRVAWSEAISSLRGSKSVTPWPTGPVSLYRAPQVVESSLAETTILSLVGKLVHTKLANDCLRGELSIKRVEFMSGISGMNLIRTIRGSSESPPEARMRLTTRSQTRYSRAAQSASTRRSGAAGPKHSVPGMLVHH